MSCPRSFVVTVRLNRVALVDERNDGAGHDRTRLVRNRSRDGAAGCLTRQVARRHQMPKPTQAIRLTKISRRLGAGTLRPSLPALIPLPMPARPAERYTSGYGSSYSLSLLIQMFR
jgi:hypothetical protein